MQKLIAQKIVIFHKPMLRLISSDIFHFIIPPITINTTVIPQQSGNSMRLKFDF